MARYFKYKTLDDLRREFTRLGLSLIAQEDIQPLFQSAVVAHRGIGNRLCIQPMEGCDADLDGFPGELTFRRYQRFGSGGAKLIWVEACAVLPEGRANPRQLLATSQHTQALAKIADTIRQAHRGAFSTTDDLLIGLQLTHSGRHSCERTLLACHDPLLDPRTTIDKSRRKVDAGYPLLSDADLAGIEDAYVAAARVAYSAGFDFIDIKQCHRYLLNELLSARTRPGPYGGSYENRTRLARNIFTRIRAELPGLAIASRLSVYDGLPFHKSTNCALGQQDQHSLPLENYWGTDPLQPGQADLAEPLRWIGELRDLGICMINVSLGNPYTSPHLLRPFEHPPPDGYETPEHPLFGVDRHIRLAGQIQTAFLNLPVVGSGYSWLQEFLFNVGAATISAKRATFIGVGRASLAQPDFAKQLMDHGRLDRRRVCRTFSYCTALMRSKHNEMGQFATGCPPFDKEGYGTIWKESIQANHESDQ